ncbi:hypothetical protein [Actinoplanes sp. NPDC051494]|uniref:hypothetical protein n=1 Tax=Actinoplanes sp. NPDC051494 TaxID=3363907 RepID=UPI00379C0AB7
MTTTHPLTVHPLTAQAPAAAAVARPVDAVAGLLPGRAHADAAMRSLSDAGFIPRPIRPQQAGPCHLRDWGRDATIMNLYLAGWQQGHILLIVPAAPAARETIGRLLSHHRGHAIYYFARTGVESLSALT